MSTICVHPNFVPTELNGAEHRDNRKAYRSTQPQVDYVTDFLKAEVIPGVSVMAEPVDRATWTTESQRLSFEASFLDILLNTLFGVVYFCFCFCLKDIIYGTP